MWGSVANHSPPLKGRGRGGECNLLFPFVIRLFSDYCPHPLPLPYDGRGVLVP